MRPSNMKRKRNSSSQQKSPDMVLHRTYRGNKAVPVSSATQGLAHKLRTLSVPIVDIRKDNLLLNLGLEDQGHGVWRFNANLKPKRYHRPTQVRKENKEEIPSVKVDGKPLGRKTNFSDPKFVTDNGLSGKSVVESGGRRTNRKCAVKSHPIVIDLSSDEENFNVCEPNSRVRDRKRKLNSLSISKNVGKQIWVKDKTVDSNSEEEVELTLEHKSQNTKKQTPNNSSTKKSLHQRNEKFPVIHSDRCKNKDITLPLGSNGVKKNSKVSVKRQVSSQKATVEKNKFSLLVGQGKTLRKRIDENRNKKTEEKCGSKLVVSSVAGASKRKRGDAICSSLENIRPRRVQSLLNKKSEVSKKTSSSSSSQTNSIKLGKAVAISKKKASPEKSKRSSGSKKNSDNDRDYKVSPRATSNGKKLQKSKITRKHLNKSQMYWCQICGTELDSLDNKLEHEFSHQEPRQLVVLLRRCYLNSTTIKLPIYVSTEDLAAIPEPEEDMSSPIASDDETHPRLPVENVLNDDEENAYESYSSSDDEFGISSPLGKVGTQESPSTPLGAPNRVVVLVDAATSPFTTSECGTPVMSPRSVGSRERSKRKSQVKMRLWEGPPITRSGRVVKVTERTKEGMEQSSCVRALFIKDSAKGIDNSSLPTEEGNNVSGQLIAGLDDVNKMPNAEDMDVNGLPTSEGADFSSLPSTERSDATSFKTAEGSDVSNLPTTEDSDSNDGSEQNDQVKEVHKDVGEDKLSCPVAAENVDIASMEGDVVGSSYANSVMSNTQSPDDEVELRLEESDTNESISKGNDANNTIGTNVSVEKIEDELLESKNTADEESKDDKGSILEENSKERVDSSLSLVETAHAQEPCVRTNDAAEAEVIESSSNITSEIEEIPEKAVEVGPMRNVEDEGSSIPEKIVDLKDKSGGDSMGEEKFTGNEHESVADMNQNVINDVELCRAVEEPVANFDPLEESAVVDSNDMIEERVVNDNVQEGKLSDPEDLETVPKKDLMTEDKIGEMLEDALDKSSKDVMLVDEGNEASVGGAVAETMEMQEPENEFIDMPNDVNVGKFNKLDDEGLEDISDDEWTDISDQEMQQSPQLVGGILGDVEMDEGPASAVDNLEGEMDLEETEKDASQPDPMCTGDVAGENEEEEMKDLESAEDAMMADNMMEAMVGVLPSKDDIVAAESIESAPEVDMTESGEEPDRGCIVEDVSTIQVGESVVLGEKIEAGGRTTVGDGPDALVPLDLPREEQIVNTTAENIGVSECKGDKNVLSDDSAAEVLVEVTGGSKLSVNGLEVVAVVGNGGGENGDMPCGERVEVAETTESVFFESGKGDKGNVLNEYSVPVKNEICAARRRKDAGK